MGNFIKGDDLEGLVVFLNEKIFRKNITVENPSVFVSYMKWAGTLSTPPLSGLPSASPEFAKSIGGRIPPGMLNKIANDAGLTLKEAKGSGLSLWDLISTAAAIRKRPETRKQEPEEPLKRRAPKRGNTKERTTKIDLACQHILANPGSHDFTPTELGEIVECDPSIFSRTENKRRIADAKVQSRKAGDMTRGFYTGLHQVDAPWDQNWNAVDASIDGDA